MVPLTNDNCLAAVFFVYGMKILLFSLLAFFSTVSDILADANKGRMLPDLICNCQYTFTPKEYAMELTYRKYVD